MNAHVEPPPPAADPLMLLQAHQCKWPIGDPLQPGFRFCAKTRVGDQIYCHEHCCLGYPGYREKHGR